MSLSGKKLRPEHKISPSLLIYDRKHHYSPLIFTIMKTGIQSIRFAIAGLLALCVLTGLLFTSCKKELEQPREEETVQAPDSIQDLIAYFNSQWGILLVAPGYEAQVLDYLSAQPTSQVNHYLLAVFSTSGESVSFAFTLQTVPQEEIFLVSKEQPVFVKPGEDDNGVKFKVYKNATCPEKTNQNTMEAGAWVNLPQIDPVSEAASYRSKVEEKHTKCIYNKNESNKCTEFLKKVGTTTYNDKLDGKGDTVKTEDYLRYRCD